MSPVSLFTVLNVGALFSSLTLTPAPRPTTSVTVRGVAMEEDGVLPRVRIPRVRFPRRHSPAVSSEPMAVIDRRLRLLVSQQERFYAQQSRYGKDVAQVAQRDVSKDRAMDAVQVQVLYADRRGWTAIASHPGAAGKTCVVYVGYREALPLIPRTRADAAEARDEGRPACDK